MNKFFVAFALVVSSLAFSAEWTIDTEHSSADFSVSHLIVTTATGTLGPVTGKVELNDADFSKTQVSAAIDVKGLSTRNQKRDEHILSNEFFDADKYPSISFTGTKFEKLGKDKVKISGNLTIKDVTKSVTVLGNLSPVVDNPLTKGKMRAFTGTTTLSRSQFNVGTVSPKIVGDEVKVTLNVELHEASSAAAPAAK